MQSRNCSGGKILICGGFVYQKIYITNSLAILLKDGLILWGRYFNHHLRAKKIFFGMMIMILAASKSGLRRNTQAPIYMEEKWSTRKWRSRMYRDFWNTLKW